MSKFDIYFKLHCSSAQPMTIIDLPIPMQVYDKNGNKMYLLCVQQTEYNGHTERTYECKYPNGTLIITSDENNILLEEELYWLQSNTGKLLYV